MRTLTIGIAAALATAVPANAQEPDTRDSLLASFWKSAHAAAVGAQDCVGDAISNRPVTGVACRDARGALEQAFEALVQLEAFYPESARFTLRGEEQTLRNLMIAPAGLIYLVAEAEYLQGRSDRRRKVEIAATLVGRQVVAEVLLEELGQSVPTYSGR